MSTSPTASKENMSTQAPQVKITSPMTTQGNSSSPKTKGSSRAQCEMITLLMQVVVPIISFIAIAMCSILFSKGFISGHTFSHVSLGFAAAASLMIAYNGYEASRADKSFWVIAFLIGATWMLTFSLSSASIIQHSQANIVFASSILIPIGVAGLFSLYKCCKKKFC